MSGILGQGPLFIICLAVVLGIVVVVHELGHYLAGRAFGAAAESFSVGFGKPIFERKDKRNTRWRINWIPLGGFVKFVGEAQTADDVGQVEEGPVGKPYMDLSVGQRSIVSLAGPFANFISAILLFAVLAVTVPEPLQELHIGELEEGPAKEAGLLVEDQILEIDGKPIRNFNRLRQKLILATGNTLTFKVDRDGEERFLDVVPARLQIDNGLGQTVGLGGIGARIRPTTISVETYSFSEAIPQGASETWNAVTMTGAMLGRLVTGKEPITMLSGPIGIGDTTRRAVSNTLAVKQVPLSLRLKAVGLTLLQICAFVSVGIGLFNLLPLPVLDGGHLVFNAYEAVTGSVLPERVQEISLTFGAAFLLSVAVVVTFGDIVKTGIFQGIGG